MPTPSITPATFGTGALDPSTVSDGKVKRARRVAARAKTILEDKGWTQNQGIGSDGEVCLSQAIQEARNVRSKPGLMPLQSSVMSNIIAGILEEARPKVTRRAPAFEYLTDVVNWNDKSGRTKEQVVALLDAAANG